ncbi:transcription factor A, mitochondrial isoform X2 [Linepithema humile]|uniref:transcription factor A, mitochondrial isoform X2 n=1 Tax=Linepithema humile TaxID=83485 RepID=UPI00062358C8|nr:PREDICTED: ARS-binding factor 2, mitochondrial isoform X2 [Linepithema humile]
MNMATWRRLATQNPIMSKLKRNIEKDILPPKPKKPLNPFIQYCLSVKNTLQKEYPDCTYVDVVKRASKQWAQVEPKVKESLKKQYMEQQSIYKQKLQDYENSITSDQKLLIKKELIKKEHAWEKSQVKQKLTELGKPKRPLSAFFLFLQNKQSAKDPQVPYKDWTINLSEEWKNMTTEAKEKYVVEATHLYEKYKIELKKWEEDMIQAGHHNLLKSNVKSNVKSKRVTNIHKE